MIDSLNQEHEQYRDRKEMWLRYRDFYLGGEQLRRNAAKYLIRRQKEPGDVYSERLLRVFYENYLGSCIDWYAASAFRSRPSLRIESERPDVQRFYAEFVEDCDCRGTNLIELARKAFVDALVFGESYVLVDFPRVGGAAQSQADEDALGKSRAYLAAFSPLDLINWKRDTQGFFEWVVLRTEETYQRRFDSPEVITETRWLYYDRDQFRVYSSKRQAGSSPDGEHSAALVDSGRHSLAGTGQTPLVGVNLADGLWLANKSVLLAQEHFNKSNALSWALHMGLFAMPVVYSDRDWQQMVGEAYYIQLGPDDRFGWTEPEGKVFQIAADNLERLKDEIYRTCYLMTQAGGREARHLAQSGASKQRDFAVTHEVLRAYGSTVKEFLRSILEKVAAARRDAVEFHVSGMDRFEAPGLADELESATQLQGLGLRSERFRKEVEKRVALRYLEDSPQEAKNAVVSEIEAN